MLLLKLLRNLFKVLNDDIAPKQVAAGFAFGIILGLTPFFSPHNILVLLLICIIRVNVSSVILSMAVFKLFGLLVDPVSHQLGYMLLVDFGFLNGLWTLLYNMLVIGSCKGDNFLDFRSVLCLIARL